MTHRKEESIYEKLGVTPDKSSVADLFRSLIHNECPGAFVNIDINPETKKAYTVHIDGDGSKFIQRCLHYFVNGDPRIFQDVIDDMISMNTGDVCAAGFAYGVWRIVQVININSFTIPKEVVLLQVAIRLKSILDLYKEHGFDIKLLGGETAELPIQVKSATNDLCISAETDIDNLIKGNVKAGDAIYGFASDGQAEWEDYPNSGLMSNGVTMARIILMSIEYSFKFAFLSGNSKDVAFVDKLKISFLRLLFRIPGLRKHLFKTKDWWSPLTQKYGLYSGQFTVNDRPLVLDGMSVSEAILSPTRQFALVIKTLMDELKNDENLHLLHGISMNTGGGLTKIKNVGDGILYDIAAPKAPGIFRLIQKESGETWRNMYETFNCGVGLTIVGENTEEFFNALQRTEIATGVTLFRLGHCEANEDKKKNSVKIDGLDGRYYY